MKIDLSTVDWVSISSIASLLMVIITFCTLRQNRNQLNEIRLQWKEERRARLEFSVVINGTLIILKIHNIGKGKASNIKLLFNPDFLELVYISRFKDLLKTSSSKNLSLIGDKAYYVPLAHTYSNKAISFDGENYKKESFSAKELKEVNDKLIENPITINGSYTDNYNKKHKINEVFYIKDFIGSLVVDELVIQKLSDINSSLNKLRDK